MIDVVQHTTRYAQMRVGNSNFVIKVAESRNESNTYTQAVYHAMQLPVEVSRNTKRALLVGGTESERESNP